MFHKDRKSYLCFYKILGFFPKNIELYEQALLHKSSSLRSEQGRPINNERLEFLGDAILDAIVGDIVYKHFEGKREGFLTNTRSKIVQRETLNKLAVEIGLDKLIKYSARSSSHNSYMYGNAFEAFIGAIYLDQGYRKCKKFLEERIIAKYIDLDKLSKKEVNFKSKLIEWCQKNKVKVSFELIEQTLDEKSNPMFQTEVLIEGITAGDGNGYSKKESQQNAAKMALKKIKSDQTFAARCREATREATSPDEVGVTCPGEVGATCPGEVSMQVEESIETVEEMLEDMSDEIINDIIDEMDDCEITKEESEEDSTEIEQDKSIAIAQIIDALNERTTRRRYPFVDLV
nr:ribonuclease III [Bacteroides sp. 51]